MFSNEDWQYLTDAALAWLRRSISATGGRGSAHSYSPFFGWANAYPETTGYLIETLLHYAEVKNDDSLRQLALNCAEWLCEVQLPDGAFQSGKSGDKLRPSVFNTSQVLFGLACYPALPQARRALERATDWLMNALEPDGAWRQAAYVPGFVPSYYTRAVWGVLKANIVLQQPEIQENMRCAIHFYAERFQPNGAVADWGFRPGQPAFTHTLAYTLEGFLESALLLNEPGIVQKTVESANHLLAIRQAKERTAGRYDADWRGDYSFLCPVGNAQLSRLFFRLYDLTGVAKYRQAAWDFLNEILDCQVFGGRPDAFGALPGSRPFWGPYLRFRYPNWAAKFFLDALFNFRPGLS